MRMRTLTALRSSASGVALATLALCSLGPTAAQSTGPANPPTGGQASGATVRTVTRLIQVSLIAQDKHGQPITDLTKEDFKLFDKGGEEKIEFFSMESLGLMPRDSEPSQPDTWTNRWRQRDGVPTSVTVILLDGLNTRLQDQAYARDQVVRFLSQLRPDDRVALYTLGSQLHVVHDFTKDASSLLRGLSKYKAYNGPSLPAELLADRAMPKVTDAEEQSGISAVDSFIIDADAAISQNLYIQRAYRTTDALEAIAMHLGPIPGRKNLIWVSGGFPIIVGYGGLPVKNQPVGTDSRNFMKLTERATRALNGANMAVYPVDAGGLTSLSRDRGQQTMPGDGTMRRMSPGGGVPVATTQDYIQDTLVAMAERTGGRAFYNTNDLSGAIRQAVDDSRVIYSLAYTPTHGVWDGKFRPIKIECRRQGVRLRYRSGYVAVPDNPLDAGERQQLLLQAAWSPLVATEIGLTARMSPGTLEGRPAKVLVVTVPPEDLRFTEAEERHISDMLLVVMQRSADGAIVHSAEHNLSLRLKEDNYKTVKQYGMRVTVTVEPEPNATRFRLVMLDGATGRLGSLDIPLVSPAASGKAGAAPVQAKP